jgi:hypothetical protein
MKPFIVYITGLLGFVSFVVATVYERKFYHYLRAEHPTMAEKFIMQSFMGISKDNWPIEPVNGFKELWFVFTPDSLGDEKISRFKRKIRLSFLAGIFLWISSFVYIASQLK